MKNSAEIQAIKVNEVPITSSEMRPLNGCVATIRPQSVPN